MICPKCGNDVRSHERNCAVCDADVGYPNVRAAQNPDEVSALEGRLAEASEECAARGSGVVLAQFQEAARTSKAVLNRSLHQVMSLVSSDNELYATFYAQIASQSVERERLIADNLLFPYFHHEIRFASLSLDDTGVRHYGACALAISELAIKHRATVFEKNSVEFCREHKLGAGKPVPQGYRAVWEDRGKLAAAKLHSRLDPNLGSSQFANVLLSDIESEAPPDFIEVHIYGPLHRRAIETVAVRGPIDPSDEALLLEIERRAEEFNAKVVRINAP